MLGGSGGWQSAKARLCDQEVGADSPPSDELCGHFISLAICKMGPCLAPPSSRVSCRERTEERQSRRWDFHSHLGGRVWGEDVQKFSGGTSIPSPANEGHCRIFTAGYMIVVPPMLKTVLLK